MKFLRYARRFQQLLLDSNHARPRGSRASLAVERLESRIVLSALAEKPAILLLDPSASGALSVTGNGSVAVTGRGPIVIDSSNASAAVASGNAHLTAQEFDVSGPGVVVTGSAKFQGPILSSGFALFRVNRHEEVRLP
jgi:hypothetical protein